MPKATRIRIKCPHGKRECRCKQCKGVSICPHGKVKYNCKQCKGNGICKHNRKKQICKECGGSGICEHNRQRHQCHECKGSQICEHSRRKAQCKQCKGSQICEHNQWRAQCKYCGGSQICPHDKRRYNCHECCSHELQFSRFCLVCGQVDVKRRITGTPGVCRGCDKTLPELIAHKVKRILLETLPPPSASDSTYTGLTCDTSRRRADLLWVGMDRVLQVEIDEEAHADRSVECELAKIHESKWGLSEEDQQKPLIMIRFNPISVDRGCQCVIELFEHWRTCIMWDKLRINVLYVDYPEDSVHIAAARSKSQFIVEEYHT